MWYVKISEFCLEKAKKLHVNVFKYSLPSLHKYSREIMLNLTKIHSFTQFLTRRCSESNSSNHLHTEYSKQNSIRASFVLITIIRILAARFNVSWPIWVQQSISMHFSHSMSVKFRYDTPSFAMHPTQNNPQDLDLEYLKATLPVKWTLSDAGKPQCCMIGVPVLCPAETEIIQ